MLNVRRPHGEANEQDQTGASASRPVRSEALAWCAPAQDEERRQRCRQLLSETDRRYLLFLSLLGGWIVDIRLGDVIVIYREQRKWDIDWASCSDDDRTFEVKASAKQCPSEATLNPQLIAVASSCRWGRQPSSSRHCVVDSSSASNGKCGTVALSRQSRARKWQIDRCSGRR